MTYSAGDQVRITKVGIGENTGDTSLIGKVGKVKEIDGNGQVVVRGLAKHEPLMGYHAFVPEELERV